MIGYGVYEWYELPFSSALFVETLETGPDEYGIRLNLRNGSDTAEMTNLVIPGMKVFSVKQHNRHNFDQVSRLLYWYTRKSCFKDNTYDDIGLQTMLLSLTHKFSTTRLNVYSFQHIIHNPCKIHHCLGIMM